MTPEARRTAKISKEEKKAARKEAKRAEKRALKALGIDTDDKPGLGLGRDKKKNREKLEMIREKIKQRRQTGDDSDIEATEYKLDELMQIDETREQIQEEATAVDVPPVSITVLSSYRPRAAESSVVLVPPFEHNYIALPGKLISEELNAHSLPWDKSSVVKEFNNASEALNLEELTDSSKLDILSLMEEETDCIYVNAKENSVQVLQAHTLALGPRHVPSNRFISILKNCHYKPPGTEGFVGHDNAVFSNFRFKHSDAPILVLEGQIKPAKDSSELEKHVINASSGQNIVELAIDTFIDLDIANPNTYYGGIIGLSEGASSPPTACMLYMIKSTTDSAGKRIGNWNYIADPNWVTYLRGYRSEGSAFMNGWVGTPFTAMAKATHLDASGSKRVYMLPLAGHLTSDPRKFFESTGRKLIKVAEASITQGNVKDIFADMTKFKEAIRQEPLAVRHGMLIQMQLDQGKITVSLHIVKGDNANTTPMSIKDLYDPSAMPPDVSDVGTMNMVVLPAHLASDPVVPFYVPTGVAYSSTLNTNLLPLLEALVT